MLSYVVLVVLSSLLVELLDASLMHLGLPLGRFGGTVGSVQWFALSPSAGNTFILFVLITTGTRRNHDARIHIFHLNLCVLHLLEFICWRAAVFYGHLWNENISVRIFKALLVLHLYRRYSREISSVIRAFIRGDLHWINVIFISFSVI